MRAISVFLLAAAALAGAPAAAQQLVSISGSVVFVPPDVATGLAASPSPVDPRGDPGEGLELRWPDGRVAILVMETVPDPLADLPPDGVAAAFDADGVARIPESWAKGADASGGEGYADAASRLRASGLLRSYLVRTGNPAYPLARVVCGTYQGDAGCSVYSRVGPAKRLVGRIAKTDAGTVSSEARIIASAVSQP